MPSRLLSKSKYMTGRQCPKLLWVSVNDPKRLPEIDTATQYVFDQGHLVGGLAKGLFPNGLDVPSDNFMGNITHTKGLIIQRKTIFEAGILAGNLYSRIDILNPLNDEEWEIVEVKSGTSAKDVYVEDVAFQKYCCEKTGLDIQRCRLAYINREFVKNGPIDPNDFFNLEDITEQVLEVSRDVEDHVQYLIEMVASDKCPEPGIGKYCSSPYECALQEECWSFLPEDSIFDLRGGKTKQFAFYDQGILCIKDIPEDVKLSRPQQIQRECVLTGSTHIEKEEIRTFLNKLVYPLYYLDFETIGPAVPLYDGMRPYQNLPFQFSLHIVENPHTEPIYHAFLAEGREDPRPTLLSELNRLLGSQGI